MTKKKSSKIKMSAPEGYELDTEYVMSSTHNELYWDTDRNGKDTIESEAFAAKVDSIMKKITDLLKEKNKAYGNTALNPTNIFSKLSAVEAICARLDDKIARIKNKGINDKTEDTVDDLIGYLLLLKISMNEK
jgi:Zn-dependent M32 family carboxypeptidase